MRYARIRAPSNLRRYLRRAGVVGIQKDQYPPIVSALRCRELKVSLKLGVTV